MTFEFFAGLGRLFPHALAAVRRGVGVTATRNALREAGLKFSNAAYSQAHALATRLETVRSLEVDANLAARPGASRIAYGPWGFSTKWQQVVQLQLRNKVTDELRNWDITLATDRLQTRGAAIDQVLLDVADSLDDYDQELIGASYDHTKGRVI